MSPARASVLNMFWRDHISDKYGLGGDTALRGSAEGHLLLCDGSNGQGGRMERRTMDAVVLCRVHVDIDEGRSVRRMDHGDKDYHETSTPRH